MQARRIELAAAEAAAAAAAAAEARQMEALRAAAAEAAAAAARRAADAGGRGRGAAAGGRARAGLRAHGPPSPGRGDGAPAETQMCARLSQPRLGGWACSPCGCVCNLKHSYVSQDVSGLRRASRAMVTRPRAQPHHCKSLCWQARCSTRRSGSLVRLCGAHPEARKPDADPAERPGTSAAPHTRSPRRAGAQWERVPDKRFPAARGAPAPAAPPAAPRGVPGPKLAALRWAAEESFEEEHGLLASDSGTFTDAASSASARGRASRPDGRDGATEDEWMHARSEASAGSDSDAPLAGGGRGGGRGGAPAGAGGQGARASARRGPEAGRGWDVSGAAAWTDAPGSRGAEARGAGAGVPGLESNGGPAATAANGRGRRRRHRAKPLPQSGPAQGAAEAGRGAPRAPADAHRNIVPRPSYPTLALSGTLGEPEVDEQQGPAPWTGPAGRVPAAGDTNGGDGKPAATTDRPRRPPRHGRRSGLGRGDEGAAASTPAGSVAPQPPAAPARAAAQQPCGEGAATQEARRGDSGQACAEPAASGAGEAGQQTRASAERPPAPLQSSSAGEPAAAGPVQGSSMQGPGPAGASARSVPERPQREPGQRWPQPGRRRGTPSAAEPVRAPDPVPAMQPGTAPASALPADAQAAPGDPAAASPAAAPAQAPAGAPQGPDSARAAPRGRSESGSAQRVQRPRAPRPPQVQPDQARARAPALMPKPPAAALAPRESWADEVDAADAASGGGWPAGGGRALDGAPEQARPWPGGQGHGRRRAAGLAAAGAQPPRNPDQGREPAPAPSAARGGAAASEGSGAPEPPRSGLGAADNARHGHTSAAQQRAAHAAPQGRAPPGTPVPKGASAAAGGGGMEGAGSAGPPERTHGDAQQAPGALQGQHERPRHRQVGAARAPVEAMGAGERAAQQAPSNVARAQGTPPAPRAGRAPVGPAARGGADGRNGRQPPAGAVMQSRQAQACERAGTPGAPPQPALVGAGGDPVGDVGSGVAGGEPHGDAHIRARKRPSKRPPPWVRRRGAQDPVDAPSAQPAAAADGNGHGAAAAAQAAAVPPATAPAPGSAVWDAHGAGRGQAAQAADGQERAHARAGQHGRGEGEAPARSEHGRRRAGAPQPVDGGQGQGAPSRERPGGPGEQAGGGSGGAQSGARAPPAEHAPAAGQPPAGAARGGYGRASTMAPDGGAAGRVPGARDASPRARDRGGQGAHQAGEQAPHQGCAAGQGGPDEAAVRRGAAARGYRGNRGGRRHGNLQLGGQPPQRPASGAPAGGGVVGMQEQ